MWQRIYSTDMLLSCSFFSPQSHFKCFSFCNTFYFLHKNPTQKPTFPFRNQNILVTFPGQGMFFFFTWIFKSHILMLIFINQQTLTEWLFSCPFVSLCTHPQTDPSLPRYIPSPAMFCSSVLKFWSFSKIIRLRPVGRSTVVQSLGWISVTLHSL